MDCQSWMIACGCATNSEDKDVFQSWGHSSVVSPWGKTVVYTEFEETIIYSDINLQEVQDVRNQILVLQHRRKDLYEIKANI